MSNVLDFQKALQNKRDLRRSQLDAEFHRLAEDPFLRDQLALRLAERRTNKEFREALRNEE